MSQSTSKSLPDNIHWNVLPPMNNAYFRMDFFSDFLFLIWFQSPIGDKEKLMPIWLVELVLSLSGISFALKRPGVCLLWAPFLPHSKQRPWSQLLQRKAGGKDKGSSHGCRRYFACVYRIFTFFFNPALSHIPLLDREKKGSFMVESFFDRTYTVPGLTATGPERINFYSILNLNPLKGCL